MAKINGLPKNRAFVDENGMFNTEGRTAQDEIESRIPSSGVGSPEGVVDAPVSATYYDLDGSTGSIIYVKTAQSIGGDPTKGWTLA